MLTLLRLLPVLLLTTSLACADDRTIEVKTADELIHCMAVLNWVRINTEGDKKGDADGWVHTFYGAATDLTDDNYVVRQFKLENAEFLEYTARELPRLAEVMRKETRRCYKMDFDADVVARLRLLAQSKTENNAIPK